LLVQLRIAGFAVATELVAGDEAFAVSILDTLEAAVVAVLVRASVMVSRQQVPVKMPSGAPGLYDIDGTAPLAGRTC
jgi:hypothetical protein